MPRVGFEPTISAGERPKTYALDRAATGTGNVANCNSKFQVFNVHFLKFNHFYWPTNALNCIKLKTLKSTCINILKDN